MIKGAIFDMDGTLLDSMGAWRTVASRYVKSLGKVPKEGLDEFIRQMSMFEAAQYMNTAYSLQKKSSEIMDGVIAIMENFYAKEVECKPGILECLDELTKHGVKLSIATATDRFLVELALNRTGIAHYFDVIFTCLEIGKGKEFPDIYEQALTHMGTRKEETYVFEDAYYAAETAHRAGFPVIAIYDALEPEQEKMKELADYYVSDTITLAFLMEGQLK